MLAWSESLALSRSGCIGQTCTQQADSAIDGQWSGGGDVEEEEFLNSERPFFNKEE